MVGFALACTVYTFNQIDVKRNLVSVLAVFILFLTHAAAQQVVSSALPTIDLRDWDGATVAPLNGLCMVFDHQLLTPAAVSSSKGRTIDFPGLWPESSETFGDGYATYALQVALPPAHRRRLAFSVPQMYSAYRLWANGKLVAANGEVGTSKETCRAQWLPQTVLLQAAGDTLALVLQIANFHHAHGGIKEPIYLGTENRMQAKRTIAVASNLTEMALLSLLGVFFFVVYKKQPKKRVTRYFAFLCITWAVRSIFSNLYLVTAWIPAFDWATQVRIEYLTLYFTVIWAALFLCELFQQEANRLIRGFIVGANILFIAITLLLAPRWFTQWLNIYLTVAGLLLLYGGITVIRAWAHERVGSGLLTISLVLGLNIFGYDIFVYEGFSSYDPIIFNFGYLLIFLLVAVSLSMHLNLIKSKRPPSNSLSYDDLYRKDPETR